MYHCNAEYLSLQRFRQKRDDTILKYKLKHFKLHNNENQSE